MVHFLKKMTKGEYSVWRAEIVDDIRKNNPKWNKKQINDYFEAIKFLLLLQM